MAVVLASPLHGSFAAEVLELVRRTVGEAAPGAVGKVPLTPKDLSEVSTIFHLYRGA